MAGKKILMLVGEFSEEYEIFVFEQAMHTVGHTVHVVCPDKKAGENIKTSLHDFEGDQTYTEKPGHLYTLNKTFDITLPTATFNVQRIFPADLFRGDAAVAQRHWYDNIGLTWSSQFDNRLSTTEDQLYLENLPTLSRQLRNPGQTLSWKVSSRVVSGQVPPRTQKVS